MKIVEININKNDRDIRFYPDDEERTVKSYFKWLLDVKDDKFVENFLELIFDDNVNVLDDVIWYIKNISTFSVYIYKLIFQYCKLTKKFQNINVEITLDDKLTRELDKELDKNLDKIERKIFQMFFLRERREIVIKPVEVGKNEILDIDEDYDINIVSIKFEDNKFILSKDNMDSLIKERRKKFLEFIQFLVSKDEKNKQACAILMLKILKFLYEK